MPARIAVVGSANIDFVMKCPALPTVGQTVGGCEFTRVFGGKGANQAVAAARAGGAVTFVAAVGDDPLAAAMLEQFRVEGIDIAHVRRIRDRPTGAALIMVDAEGRNYISIAPGANDAISRQQVADAAPALRAADWIVLQMETPASIVQAVLEIAPGRAVMLNYAPTRDCPIAVDDRLAALVVNETEAAALLGRDALAVGAADEAADLLRRRGPARVLLTLGGEGVCIADARGTRRAPAFRVDPVDTTAAGDTFCGALAVALGEGRPLDDAARFAQAAGALCCTRLGAQTSIPTRAEVERFAAT